MSKVLFIGLGTMGFHMAGHLSKHYDVTVYNRTNKKSAEWASKYNGSYFENLSQIDHKFDFVISCVGNDDDLVEITTSEHGCFPHLKEQTIYIDHSTVSPKIVRFIEYEAKKNNIYFLDAPISGGELGAVNGALSIMVGGNIESFKIAEDVLKSYGKKKRS